MPDPFADIRKTIEGAKERAYVHGLSPFAQQADTLLTDADALLTVVREELQKAEDDWLDAPNDERSTKEEFMARYHPALAALPEHLREKT